ncbi:MAG TPA: RNA polymerase factor sigma-54 [Rhizomicrobium sp.]|nr:RNA polymerase factor sigma-54 [Rhizomicrobium sp.]
MALTQRLEIRQGQSLVMTPQLQQAIKLLQLSNLELGEFVEQELERNPLLERDEREHAPDERAEKAESGEGEALDAALSREDFSKADDMDADRADVYPEGESTTGAPQDGKLSDWTTLRSAGPRGDGDENALERSLANEISLKDHLTDQLTIAALDGARRLIGAAIIDAIDEAGYCRGDLGEMATRLGVELETVEQVLQVVQGFEPSGVGARDLAECLAIQLREKDRFDPAMQAFLAHLDLVARRDFAGLSALCGVDAEDIADMLAEIRELTPKPGLAFGTEPVQPVVPDVFVKEGPDGAWHVELNTDTLPRLLINSRYSAKIASRDKEAKTYITECLNNANWLVKSLDQRARTILKVASEIVRQQDGFLTYGVRHLRPLNLRAVADAIVMHESTVSRVTSNKYIATPRGVFELKYFFTAAIQATNGAESHSAEAVRDRIKEMIERETGEILSDDRIVSMLTADGVNIARRTVAKYREAMRIPSSVERRRLKQGEFAGAAGR